MDGSDNRSIIDRLYLKSAVRLAAQGLYTVTRNNPRVGCILVKNGQVLGRGFHKRDGGHHAEIEALQSATQSVSGSTAFVSLEPCCMHGRTPPCSSALIKAGVARVVVAELDPNPAVSGQGLAQLENAGLQTSVLELPQTRPLNPGYRKRMKHGQPYIRLKVGMSLDGRIGTASGESQWITCPDARMDVQRLRARSGAIVSGIGTVLHDDPRFNVRLATEVYTPPIRVIFDTHGRLPCNARILGCEGDVIVVCRNDAALPKRAVKWQHGNEEGDIENVVARMGREGINEVLVEAGPTLTGSFLKSGLWDEMIVYMAPKVLGSEGLPMARVQISRLSDAIGGTVALVDQIGEDVRIIVEHQPDP